MSTSIGPAYRLKIRKYAEIDRLVKELRIELYDIAVELVMRHLAARAVTMLDRFCLTGKAPKTGKSPICIAWNNYREDVRNSTEKMERNPDNNMQFDMTLHLHRGTFYAILFTEQQAFVEAFENKFPCEDFSYYNSSDDHLKHMSRQQWKGRERVWDNILCNTSAPSMNGASFDLVRPVRWLPEGMYHRIHEHLPSFESRVKDIAFEVALEARIKERREGEPDPGEKDLQEMFSTVMEVSWELKEGLRKNDPSVKQLLAEATERVTAVLIKDPSKAIYEPFPPSTEQE